MGNDSASTHIAELLLKQRNGEDADLSTLARALWRSLGEQIPQLTASKHKDDQHRILEAHLVALGLPQGIDLQYVAGPMLWYAREQGVLPPAQGNGSGKEPWTLDQEKYARLYANLDHGFMFYGEWMTSALGNLLHQQH